MIWFLATVDVGMLLLCVFMARQWAKAENRSHKLTMENMQLQLDYQKLYKARTPEPQAVEHKAPRPFRRVRAGWQEKRVELESKHNTKEQKRERLAREIAGENE